MSHELRISPELAELLGIQRAVGRRLATLGRLQAIQARVGNHPPLVRAIAHVANAGAVLHFSNAPGVFAVPFIAPFLRGEVTIAVAHIARMGGRPVQVSLKLDRETLLTHQLICGASGVGKTAALVQEAIALWALPNLSTALFSVEGSELRALEHATDQNAVILNCEDEFSYNPIAPVEGIPVDAAADDLVRSLSVMFMGVASMSLLKPIVKRLMDEHRSGSPRTMAHLREEVRRSKYSIARDAVLNKLAVLDSPLLRSTKALDVGRLSRVHAIYLMEGLDSHLAAFFFNDVLSKTMRWKRVVQRAHFLNPDQQLVNVFLADEAQRLFNVASSMSAQDAVFVPVITAAAQGRKLGVGLVLAAQQPSLIPTSYLANAGVILAGRLGDEASNHTIRSVLALTSDQYSFYRSVMARRTFLFRKAGSALPFPVTIPHVEMSQAPFGGGDIRRWNERAAERNPLIAEILGGLESGPEVIDVVPGSAQIAAGTDLGAGTGKREGQVEPSAAIASVPVEISTSGSQDAVLAQTVATVCRFNMTREVFRALRGKLSQQDANLARRRMIAAGEMESLPVSLGGRGTVMSLVMTTVGLEKYRLAAPEPCGRGSYEHQWLSFRLAEHFRKQGKAVDLEHGIGKESGEQRARWADLWIEPEGWAVQVALHNQKRKELDAILDLAQNDSVRRVLVVGNNRKHVLGLEADLKVKAGGTEEIGRLAEHITFHLAKEFIRDVGR